MKKFILFNTRKKAEHYVKHKNAQRDPYQYYNSEAFSYHEIRKDRIVYITGWACGCGCGRGSASASVIGRIK